MVSHYAAFGGLPESAHLACAPSIARDDVFLSAVRGLGIRLLLGSNAASREAALVAGRLEAARAPNRRAACAEVRDWLEAPDGESAESGSPRPSSPGLDLDEVAYPAQALVENDDGIGIVHRGEWYPLPDDASVGCVVDVFRYPRRLEVVVAGRRLAFERRD
jgi:hypothetical protein